jgi:DNA replication protein DnaC
MNRALIHELAMWRFIAQREDALFLGPLPHTAAEDLLEIVMRRYERASTLLTSNRPVADWGKLLGDTAAVTALLDQLIQSRDIRQRCSR